MAGVRASAVTAVAVVAAMAATLSAPASAQSLGIDLTTWQVGGMVVTLPKYEGAKKYHAVAFPLVFPGSFGDEGGRVSVKAADDVRFRLLDLYGFEVGPVVGWRFGRSESDGDRLVGLDDIKGGLVVGGYAGYRFGTMLASVSYGHQVTGESDAGGLVRFGLENTFKPSKTVRITAGVGATWADSSYMETFFGVPVAKATPTRAAFAPDAGFKDVNLSLSSDFALDKSWTLKLIGQYKLLIGDASNSPLTETDSQFFAGAGLTYKIDFSGVR